MAGNGKRLPAKHGPAEDEDEKAMDPKLADQPDVPDEEMARPTKKRKQASHSSNGSGSGGKHTIDYSKSDDIGHDSSKAPKRNDFNPTGKLPEKPTPTESLREALKKQRKAEKGGNVVYWMNMRDLRIEDNRALAKASELVQAHKGGHLIVLHILSPQDYRAHDRSPRRIDFTLRNLRELQQKLEQKYNIPLVVLSHEPRTDVPNKVLQLCKEWKASHIVANIEYEVDELWRAITVVEQAHKYGLHADFCDDTYVVPPGMVTTKDGRPYSVFSPWSRAWSDILSRHPELLEESPLPKANDKSAVQSDKVVKGLFGSSVPQSIKEYECKDADYMKVLWPAGTKSAHKVLDNFIKGKGGLQVLEGPATDFSSSQESGEKGKESRLARYQTGRNLMSENGSSRISPYLSAGVISARACLRRVKQTTNNKLLVGRDSGPAAYNMEISFRDFYGHVLAAWPRVCMGRAYITKYEDVVWEYDDDTLAAWKDGRTGYPIVDAAMRQAAKQGYMHNRGRMIVAMFLTKHLMHDWRLGETWFMQNLIDGDFASNNGGWQWSASTGTDPQPYFRVFNPELQSEKCDPSGDYIRHWVPELAGVKGNAIHAPFQRLSREEFDKLDYPQPIVEHKAARDRAMHRFKHVGER